MGAELPAHSVVETKHAVIVVLFSASGCLWFSTRNQIKLCLFLPISRCLPISHDLWPAAMTMKL